MASSWEEHYGFKTEPFRGKIRDQSNNLIDITQSTTGHGIGFGPGDLRKARLEGWSALSILDYLRGPAGSGGFGTSESSQWHADTDGKGKIEQSVINELRQDQALQNRMKTAWENMPDYSELTSSVGDLSSSVESNALQISAAQQTASNALAEAQKVKDPYAVTQNSALQIQDAKTPSSAAGTISAGLAGLSRSGKKFKNTNINV